MHSGCANDYAARLLLTPMSQAAVPIFPRKSNVATDRPSKKLDDCCYHSRYLLLFSKLLAQPSFHYFFGQLWLQNFKQLFLTHFCTDSLDCLSKCVLIIITEVPVSLLSNIIRL